VEPAPRERRLTARVVDLVLEVIAGGLLGILWIDWAVDESDSEFGIIGLVIGFTVVMVLFVSLYEIAFVAWRGQTPGKMLTGIRVVRAGTGGRAGVLRAAARLLPLLTVVIPVIGYIVAVVAYGWVLVDEEGRGLHDRLAGTRVVAAR
jgi:uncharacterized RDD family membrane protein YckC